MRDQDRSRSPPTGSTSITSPPAYPRPDLPFIFFLPTCPGTNPSAPGSPTSSSNHLPIPLPPPLPEPDPMLIEWPPSVVVPPDVLSEGRLKRAALRASASASSGSAKVYAEGKAGLLVAFVPSVLTSAQLHHYNTAQRRTARGALHPDRAKMVQRRHPLLALLLLSRCRAVLTPY